MNEKIFKALGIFLDEIRPFVRDVIELSYPDEIWSGLFFSRLTPEKQSTWNAATRNNQDIDPLNLIDYNNLDTFAIKFKDELSRKIGSRNDANKFISGIQELKETRNKCQHYQAIDEDETDRTFSTLKLIAKMLKLDELYAEISELKNTTQSTTNDIPATHEQAEIQSPASSPVVHSPADSGTPLMQWFTNVRPHSDIRNGVLDESVFAANINDVVNESGPEVYLNAGQFFQKTFVTSGLRDIADRVVRALNGEESENRVISLQTGFGGGKTHTLISLYHIAKAGKNIRNVSSTVLSPNCNPTFASGEAHVAVFTNNTCDVVSGHEVQPGLTVYTLWGELAYQLGGVEAYERIKQNDELRTAPTASIFRPIIEQAAPSLILIDELADYCVKAAAIKVGDSNLFAQTNSFMQALTEVVASVQRTVLIATLPASATEVASSAIGQEILNSLETRIVRVGTSVKPVDDEEIFEVVRRRLFESIQFPEEINNVAQRYQRMYHNRRTDLPANCDNAAYTARIKKSYPFHPELIDIFRLRWGNDSRFQRTRGVLRLLASIVQNLWKQRNTITGTQALIHTSDVELGKLPTLTGQITSLMGSQWESVMQADVYGSSSNSYKIDNQDQTSDLRKYNLTQGIATTLLMASIGDNQHKGLSIEQLKLCVLRPNAYSHFLIDTSISKLEAVAHYLYSSNLGSKTFWFQSKPNINILINQAKSEINSAEIDAEILSYLNKSKQFISNINVLVAPNSDVPEQKKLTLVVLPPNLAVPAGGNIPFSVKKYVEDIDFKRGTSDRVYRNTIFYLAATERGRAVLSERIRDYLACQKILTEYSTQLDSEQKRDVATRKAKHESEISGALANAYNVVLRCSKRDGIDLYEISNSATDFSKQVQNNLIDEIKSNEWLIESMGRALLSKHNLFPSVESPVKLSDIYDAFLRFDDKPMIFNEQAVIKAAQTLCCNGMANIGVGQVGNYDKIYHNQQVAFLSINPDDEYYLIDKTILPVLPSPTPTPGGGSEPTPAQPTPSGDPTPSPTPTPTESLYRNITISGEIPVENWTQLFSSFINTLKGNKLQIEVKFTAKSTDTHPITSGSQLFKSVKESAAQLGLNLETEE